MIYAYAPKTKEVLAMKMGKRFAKGIEGVKTGIRSKIA